jgi:RNA polymerase sigma-70 factor (ECF subfamily)
MDRTRSTSGSRPQLPVAAPRACAQHAEWLRIWPQALPALRRVARTLTRDGDEAEDLLQETAVRAHRFASGYRQGTCVRAWLHRILRNTFASRYRKRRREREVIERAHLEGALAPREPARAEHEPSIVASSIGDELTRELAALAPEFRAVLVHVAIDGLSYRETAEALGCPIGTVMSRLHRARRSMRGTEGVRQVRLGRVVEERAALLGNAA